jgi:hypothetical protein
MATYSQISPWAETAQNSFYLEEWAPLAIPYLKTDYLYSLEVKFKHRPDLLAYELYGYSELWWVFAQRNPEVIKDPIYDFEPGVVIYVPQATSLKQTLGIA